MSKWRVEDNYQYVIDDNVCYAYELEDVPLEPEPWHVRLYRWLIGSERRQPKRPTGRRLPEKDFYLEVSND